MLHNLLMLSYYFVYYNIHVSRIKYNQKNLNNIIYNIHIGYNIICVNENHCLFYCLSSINSKTTGPFSIKNQ